ncbi:nitrate ABC transporter, ATPase subunits C and D [Thalassoporum mexicanum PCC 7367]|uniref:ABC transporter ATP-binding/substrate-binding protein n=1 Tax=Thalassoporum mexicanum TaxID=3457544 RepID=UPI00029F93EC|nr:nitrate ABC transporter ATP-binding protein [Pseudanabaena sp. PCC 7367]AFY70610.1 nitrate ABC transporter, ATPase subunits C and D [Pseudanabaena sp. PCC 7367]
MAAFVEIDDVSKTFPLVDGGQYIALKNIDLKIKQGEFVSLLGHSGCGKSTLLNIIAGLDRPTRGGVVLEGFEVKEPSPDRMVVFQNYSLLPWKTVRENIALAVDTVLTNLSKAERKEVVAEHINMVGLTPAADKLPEQLSGGMKQRVAIARAFSIRPKVLLLDEPFGALDALTRGGLQEELMQICQENQVTCIMVTHDADEALLLSDRIIMLTNGPEAHIGQILEVPIPRPRRRMEVVNHPNYYSLRGEIIYFLNQQKRAKKRKALKSDVVAGNGLEKVNLEIGFIPLTDCAPFVVAHEKGFFKKHGLTDVHLVRTPNWKVLDQSIASGQIDAAQMLAGMPIAMTLGAGMTGKPVPIRTSMVLSRNGNAITWSKQLYDQGVRDLESFKAYISADPDRLHTLGMVYPSSMHNLMLRYWLATGGIDPDRDVNLTVTPPPQMVSNLRSGNIDGYCVGGPWNSRAVHEGLGTVLATDIDLWPGHVEKVLGVREDWAYKYPKTHIALVKALLEACAYCDDRRNREEILELICRSDYVGSDPAYTRVGFIDPYRYSQAQEPVNLNRYNQFYVDGTNYPDRSEMLWVMTEMARWGIVPFPKNWVEVIELICQTDVFSAAAKQLEYSESRPERKQIQFFDGITFDASNPIQYLDSLAIKGDIKVMEILVDEMGAIDLGDNPSYKLMGTN